MAPKRNNPGPQRVKYSLYQQHFAILQILGILLIIYLVCTLIDFVRQGLFAVTVNRNRGRWLELVWDGIEKQIKHLQEE